MIATRRNRVLNRALQVARWIFSSGRGDQKEIIAQLVLQGLRYLGEELRYDRDHSDEAEIPLLRWGCAHLAQAMVLSGYQADPIVMHWVQLALEDPLPEVRLAYAPVSALLEAHAEG